MKKNRVVFQFARAFEAAPRPDPICEIPLALRATTPPRNLRPTLDAVTTLSVEWPLLAWDQRAAVHARIAEIIGEVSPEVRAHLATQAKAQGVAL